MNVVKESDRNEWVFTLRTEAAEPPALLRIRVYGQDEPRDVFDNLVYEQLEKRGVYEYYAAAGQIIGCAGADAVEHGGDTGAFFHCEILEKEGASLKRILIAEDEDVIRDFIVINLKRAGYDVVDVPDGEQALQVFEQSGGDFDVVVLDIMMPGIDGFGVCEKIRAASNTIGIIMLSAKSQEMDKVRGLMTGADDYITKPFSPSELVARVDAIYRRVSLAKDVAAAKRRDCFRSLCAQQQKQNADQKRENR